MILSCQNICKAFGEKVILNDASFILKTGKRQLLSDVTVLERLLFFVSSCRRFPRIPAR